MKKDNKVYIVHVIECIESIEIYSSNGKDCFIGDNMAYDATLRKLQIMSESTQRLSDELKNEYTDIEWRKISGFRNILVHEYLGDIDNEIIWSIIENMLPKLKSVMTKELSKFDI